MSLTRTSSSETSRREAVETLLTSLDVRVGGGRPWDLQVHDERFFRRVLRTGVLGLGESYMEGWWDAPAVDQLVERLATLDRRNVPLPLRSKWVYFAEHILNRQRKSRAVEVAERHYNLGNDLFEAMLDPHMSYSCGYWRDAHTLDDAQTAKLDLICRKLDLRPGQSVLEIGSGWGSFVKYAAEHYGITALAINNSTEQTALARERCRGLPIELRLQDYRDVTGSFDHVVSIAMFEAVGWRNYRKFFEVVARCLKDDGLFLLHTIGSRGAPGPVDPWTDKYIFPNGSLPSIEQIAEASQGLFIMEDWHTFGAYYDPTLMAWFANFDRAWPSLRPRYGDDFYRMWKFYLLSCAGSFRARRNNVWHIVFSKRGVRGGYRATR